MQVFTPFVFVNFVPGLSYFAKPLPLLHFRVFYEDIRGAEAESGPSVLLGPWIF
jgi:hypothetical protein